MVATYDRIREEQERLQNDLQNAQAEQARTTPNVADKISVRTRKKSGRDEIRRARTGYEETASKAYKAWPTKKTPRPSSRTTHAGTSTPAGGYTLEGNYPTKADANAQKRTYKATHFATVRRLGDGTYNLWIKARTTGTPTTGGTAKAKKYRTLREALADKNLTAKERIGIIARYQSKEEGKFVDTAGRTVANLTALGSVPQYTPPNMHVEPSHFKMGGYTMGQYKMGDYKMGQVTNPPYQYSGYKPMGNEPYFKTQPYQPIGEFGGGMKPSSIVSSGEPKHKKRKKKTSEPGFTGA